jgi:hypothetical protein
MKKARTRKLSCDKNAGGQNREDYLENAVARIRKLTWGGKAEGWKN